MKSAAELVFEIRKKEGLSQEEFAKKLGYTSKSTINKIEKGVNDISYEKLVKLIEDYCLTYKDFQTRNKIETERLILRYLNDKDLESVFNNYANDDDVTKYLTWSAHKTIEDTQNAFKFWQDESPELKKYHYFIELKETHELIGSCAVVKFNDGIPEIGYVLGKKWWNKGIMTEACKKLIDILIEDGYSKILIKAVEDNIGSIRVIEKCGFKFVKQDKVFQSLKNITQTCNFYEICNEKLDRNEPIKNFD